MTLFGGNAEWHQFNRSFSPRFACGQVLFADLGQYKKEIFLKGLYILNLDEIIQLLCNALIFFVIFQFRQKGFSNKIMARSPIKVASESDVTPAAEETLDFDDDTQKSEEKRFVDQNSPFLMNLV